MILKLKVKYSDNADCFAVDVMYLLNQIIPKAKWIKTGADLAKEFCKRIDNKAGNASVVVVAFDTYITKRWNKS